MFARILLAMIAIAPAVRAAEPFIEKIDLFEAGKGGYALYHIPGIVVTAKGTVLAWCEARQKGGDWDQIEILLRRSTDEGKTWSEPKKIADVPGPKKKNPFALALKNVRPEDVTYNNPVLIADRDGTIHFVFCLEYERVFYARSNDDGVTFTAPAEITATFEGFRAAYDWKVLATGPNHGIQLKTGRLIVPVWLSTGTGGNAHRPSVTATIYSDDQGKTWRASEIAVPCTDVFINPNETTAVELSDGSVMLNVRNESKAHRRIVVTSKDGATGWSAPRFDDALVEPICMGALVRYSLPENGQKGRILFTNPDNLKRADGKEAEGKNRDRRNLTVRVSEDEGKTWPISRPIEPEWSMYSDIAVTKSGVILSFYGRGAKANFAGDRLTVARYNLEWITQAKAQNTPIPAVDLSADDARHVVIAQGTPTIYQGHPTTLLMPDGKTIFAVWTLGHGGVCGPMKRSDDGGKTWSELLTVPDNWAKVRNCPAIYRLTDPKGVARLFVFAGQGEDKLMASSHSTDDGKTWSPMTSIGLQCVMPFCTIEPIDGGKRLLAMTNIRRPGETKDKTSNVVAQSTSDDGGLTWSPWQIVLDLGHLKPCEPWLVRSPDKKQLLCLMRENTKTTGGLFMTSDDEGRTWSESRPLPPGLHGDRHVARYTADGRLVVCFRDTGKASPFRTHFVAWVGRYEDIVAGRDGQCRVKLLTSHAGGDCGYPGVEVLPDDTVVATTYIKYRAGPDKQSVVSVRFKLSEIDELIKQGKVGDATTPVLPAKSTVDEATQAAPLVFKPSGVVLDDTAGTFVGDWQVATKQPPIVGNAYRHDGDTGRGEKSAKFVTRLPAAGAYEVRVLYTAHANRSTKTPITVLAANGEQSATLDQRSPGEVNGVPVSAGVFNFAADRDAVVTISNAGADGYVVVDAVQFVPVATAKLEREEAARIAATQPARPGAQAPVARAPDKPADPVAAAAARAEPVRLAAAAKPADVHGKTYDLVVVGGTGGGVACAVRAAREGLSVLVVQHNDHLGGMMINGLVQWDALYGGRRSALFSELLANIEHYYRTVYGEGSRDFAAVKYGQHHYPLGHVEPHVAEREFNRLIAGEKRITVLLGHYPVAVKTEGRFIRSVTLRPLHGDGAAVEVSAAVFADATYEADLAAVAKVAYRVGREARDEYNEPHAGKVFTNIANGPAPRDAVDGRLNIRPYGSKQGTIDPTSPFTADAAIQAYNYRFCVTNDPANRIMLTEPPANYRREEYLKFDRRYIGSPKGPNGKSHMNSPILTGENHGYPEADWPTRDKITRRHLEFALGLIWFLQNDESISASQRQSFRAWGLPKDEYADNGHVPYEMYVRETRRIVGRHVYTQHDNSLAPNFARTPVHPDSIAITDWYMDSHSCTLESRPGYKYDGKLILTEESRPGQIPYRSLVPRELDNLLVPVCLSCTHVAWGAIRLEPVFLQVGEAAGFAAAIAVQGKTTPAAIDTDALLRKLVDSRAMVSFFNDVDVAAQSEWIPAVQFFGTKGMFHSYDAEPLKPLKQATAAVWVEAFAKLVAGEKYDPTAQARKLAEAEKDAATINGKSFAEQLNAVLTKTGRKPVSVGANADAPMTRAAACVMMDEALKASGK